MPRGSGFRTGTIYEYCINKRVIIVQYEYPVQLFHVLLCLGIIVLYMLGSFGFGCHEKTQ